MDLLHKILTPEKGPSASFMAQRGMDKSTISLIAQKDIFSTLSCKTGEKELRIIDSGATDHMTRCVQLFSTNTPNCTNLKVKIANCSFSKLPGIGAIKINYSCILKSVLHVPKLSCNLLSLTSSQKIIIAIIFSQDQCIFQDLSTGKKIGNAREQEGLYFLGDNSKRDKHAYNVSEDSNQVRRGNIMLWHFRLGHPSFSYLKHLFPFI